MASSTLRPTKKQKLLLEFIQSFIAQHGYSPSYREIMNGAGYNSVATVAVHINNLVARGHLIKREHSARSLEPTNSVIEFTEVDKNIAEKSAWLFNNIEKRFKAVEQRYESSLVDEIYVLIGAVKVLGFEDQARAFAGRILALDKKA